jgi:hypothetical protein
MVKGKHNQSDNGSQGHRRENGMLQLSLAHQDAPSGVIIGYRRLVQHFRSQPGLVIASPAGQRRKTLSA